MGNGPALVFYGRAFFWKRLSSLLPKLHWRGAWALDGRCGPRAGASEGPMLVIVLPPFHPPSGIVLALWRLPYILPAPDESVWGTPFRPSCSLRSSRHCLVRCKQRRREGAKEDFFDVNNRCACCVRVLVVGALGWLAWSRWQCGETRALSQVIAHTSEGLEGEYSPVVEAAHN